MSGLSSHLYLDGRWVKGEGEAFFSHSPIDGSLVGVCQEASPGQLFQALEAAKKAQRQWRLASYQTRVDLLLRCQAAMKESFDQLSSLISQEMGKPLWEAKTEVAASLAKFEASIEAYQERCSEKSFIQGEATVVARYRPLGVVAILGPFNFPLHLPQGQIVPALLAGNAVIFKPSEKTPYVGQALAELWQKAGCPQGVFQLIQGGKEVGQLLSQQEGLDGLFFTGSWQTGSCLMRQGVHYPHRMLALEMGGNNPLVVWGAGDLNARLSQIIFSAFITTGQRCSCARRLIIEQGKASELLLAQLAEACQKLPFKAGAKEPFMGPLIDQEAAAWLWGSCDSLLKKGAKPLLLPEAPSKESAYLGPMIVDVTDLEDRGGDEELFGPLLKVIRVKSFDAAIEECNQTKYGLCASLLCDDEALWQQFLQEVKAGVINWNNPTTGASAKAPFGGLGRSGNFRPGGYSAADYCSYQQASTMSSKMAQSLIVT